VKSEELKVFIFMKIKVLLFGALSNIADKSILYIENVIDTESLVLNLEKDYPKIINRKYKISVNQNIINENYVFKENDEVALLPPFAGG